MSDIPNIPNINQYHQHFKQTAPFIKNEPRNDRECHDKCCYVLFIIFTLFLIGAGAFFLAKADFGNLSTKFATNSTTTLKPTTTKPTPVGSTKEINTFDIENLKPGIPVIIGMIVLSVVLAVVFLCLIIKFPSCMFYSMLVLGAILILALAILLFVVGSVAGGVIFLVILLIYLLVIWCSRDKIKIGIVLLETAARFLSEKPTVFLAPLFVMLIVGIFELFWIASLVAISVYTGNAKTQEQIDQQQQVNAVFVAIWGFLQIFYSFFFHYCLVFIIATAAAMWYYNVDGNYLCVSLKRIISNHLGSFTFAALIMAIVTMARQSAQRQQSESSGAAAICYCLVACCLRAIQDLLQVLNHNAIIVMAVTGQSYIDSAKSAISLIFDNFLLFYLIDTVSGMLKLAGIIFISAIPGIVGFLLLRATAEDPDDVTFLTVGTMIIVLVSMLVGALFLSVFCEALSCVFIFYCLDRKFIGLNYPAPKNTPSTMRKLFDDMSGHYGGHPAGYSLPPPSSYNQAPPLRNSSQPAPIYNNPSQPAYNQPTYNNNPPAYPPYNNQPQSGYNSGSGNYNAYPRISGNQY